MQMKIADFLWRHSYRNPICGQYHRHRVARAVSGLGGGSALFECLSRCFASALFPRFSWFNATCRWRWCGVGFANPVYQCPRFSTSTQTGALDCWQATTEIVNSSAVTGGGSANACWILALPLTWLRSLWLRCLPASLYIDHSVLLWRRRVRAKTGRRLRRWQTPPTNPRCTNAPAPAAFTRPDSRHRHIS